MSADEATAETFERLWREYLDKDFDRFRARHQRARADAGPSLMGGSRSVDHWTYDYVRRNVDDCLYEGSVVLLEFAHATAVEPETVIRLARAPLLAHFERLFEHLEDDFDNPPANEFAVRPSRESLSHVRRYAVDRMTLALTSVGRGRVDERLRGKPGLLSAIAAPFGGGQRLLLVIAVVCFIVAMYAVV